MNDNVHFEWSLAAKETKVISLAAKRSSPHSTSRAALPARAVKLLEENVMTMILLGIIGAVVVWFVAAYNRFVRLRNRAEEAWSDIDVQLKRRYDLIPNLVETVKGYAKHEKDVLEAVTAARAQATAITIDAATVTPEQMAQFAAVQEGLSGALSKLLAVAENYPDLKASANFLELQRELTDTENKIQAARRFYNSVVRDFNTAIEQFPGNLIAGMFHFVKRSFFEIDDAAQREAVKVKF